MRLSGHSSLGSFGCIPGVVGFIRVCSFHSGSRAHWWSLGFFGFVVFIRVRPGDRLVHSDAFRCALGSIWVRSVNSGVPWGSFGLFAFVGIIQDRPGGRWVHAGSLGCALGVVGFIQVRWTHSGAPCVSMGAFRFVGLLRVCPGGYSVY